MKLPEEFLQSLEGVTGFQRESFLTSHETGRSLTSIRLHPQKVSHPFNANTKADAALNLIESPVAWAKQGYYLNQRPSFTFDPLFHAGCYYVQEASSMFLEQALNQLTAAWENIRVLDLSAAPGGKSTHILSLLEGRGLLVSNEVIRSRATILTDNIIKWGYPNVLVSNNDPRAFGKLKGYFDVMVVDAPCSGSGLFRKDEKAIDEWSLQNVTLCSQRQQRILADALPALKENGLLVYSTCSYSPAEDEAIMDWLIAEMGMESVALNTAAFPGIVTTLSPERSAEGYRFYPDKIKGEGFFIACFRKRESTAAEKIKSVQASGNAPNDLAIVQEWIEAGELNLIKSSQGLAAFPGSLLPDLNFLASRLNVQYFGVAVGEVLKGRLVPHHALAQSLRIKSSVPSLHLDYENAIKYLQRQDLKADAPAAGWHLVKYLEKPLGWMNVLPNRMNNYYPKEIRILKQNNTAFGK